MMTKALKNNKYSVPRKIFRPLRGTSTVEQARTLHESFHSQLERAQDGFSLVADYFGRGVFNQLTVVTDAIPTKLPLQSQSAPTTGLGAEARLRLAEGGTKSGFMNAQPSSKVSVSPMISQQPSVRVIPSLESHITRTPPRVSPTPQSRTNALAVKTLTPRASPTPTPARTSPQPPSNPFEEEEEEDYDDTKNPFAEDEEKVDTTNPFADDYDKNLNPFES